MYKCSLLGLQGQRASSVSGSSPDPAPYSPSILPRTNTFTHEHPLGSGTGSAELRIPTMKALVSHLLPSPLGTARQDGGQAGEPLCVIFRRHTAEPHEVQDGFLSPA